MVQITALGNLCPVRILTLCILYTCFTYLLVLLANYLPLDCNKLFTRLAGEMARLTEVANMKPKSTREVKKTVLSKSKSPSPEHETTLPELEHDTFLLELEAPKQLEVQKKTDPPRRRGCFQGGNSPREEIHLGPNWGQGKMDTGRVLPSGEEAKNDNHSRTKTLSLVAWSGWLLRENFCTRDHGKDDPFVEYLGW